MVLLILVGAVFVLTPAGLLASMTPGIFDTTFWIKAFVFKTPCHHRALGGMESAYGAACYADEHHREHRMRIISVAARESVGKAVRNAFRAEHDTALRSARLIAADFMHADQRPISRRLLVSLPIFALTACVMMIDFNVLWRYFAWCNQTLAVFTLWAASAYLYRCGCGENP